MINPAEEVADIRVEHPAHPLAFKPDRERVQRMMRTTPGPEPVREALEIHLIDGVEHLDHRALNDFVLQRRDPQRPKPPIRLPDIRPPPPRVPVAPPPPPPPPPLSDDRPPPRRSPVPPHLPRVVQIGETNLQSPPVVGPRRPVHPG